MPLPDLELGEEVVSESESELREPPLFKVVLHNDDFTTTDFVVFVLQSIFNHSDQTAVQIMLKVHNEGVGVAGVYTYEIAEAKSAQASALARANEFPLLCTVEED